MTLNQIAEEYIRLLQEGKTEQIIALFTNNGKVISPLYGTKWAVDFYHDLAEDTIYSRLKINHIFEDYKAQKIALYFTFNWTLKNNQKVIFDVVDILECNSDNKIEKLTIIYDTAITRKLLKSIKKI